MTEKTVNVEYVKDGKTYNTSFLIRVAEKPYAPYDTITFLDTANWHNPQNHTNNATLYYNKESGWCYGLIYGFLPTESVDSAVFYFSKYNLLTGETVTIINPYSFYNDGTNYKFNFHGLKYYEEIHKKQE